jgi:hypothetical protein
MGLTAQKIAKLMRARSVLGITFTDSMIEYRDEESLTMMTVLALLVLGKGNCLLRRGRNCRDFWPRKFPCWRYSIIGWRVVEKLMMNNIPFQAINWDMIQKTEHKGETGMSYWQTLQFGDLRIRMVEYTEGYLADHWCQKGHIVHCLEGSFVSELQNGESFTLTPGMSYVVSDAQSSHRSISRNGVKLLIIDGSFLARSNFVPPVAF